MIYNFLCWAGVLVTSAACAGMTGRPGKWTGEVGGGQDSVARALVSVKGGSIKLKGLTTVIFPAGAFAAPQRVTVAATRDPETQAAYEEIVPASDGPRLPYEIRINSGAVAPATDFEVVFALPDAFLNAVPPTHEIRVFAQILGGSELELLDEFTFFPSQFDPATKTLRVQLPKRTFTDARRSDKTVTCALARN